MNNIAASYLAKQVASRQHSPIDRLTCVALLLLFVVSCGETKTNSSQRYPVEQDQSVKSQNSELNLTTSDKSISVSITGSGRSRGAKVVGSDGLDCPDTKCTARGIKYGGYLEALPGNYAYFEKWITLDNSVQIKDLCQAGENQPICNLKTTSVAFGTHDAFAIQASFGALGDVNVKKSGSGDGTVTSNIGGIDCGAVCEGPRPQDGSVMTLTAVPDAESQFVAWEGPVSSTTSPTTNVTKNGNNITARFEKAGTVKDIVHVVPRIVRGAFVGSIPDGLVTGDKGINCPSECDAALQHGMQSDSLHLTAHNNSSYGLEFVSWEGCETSSTNTCMVSELAADGERFVYVNYRAQNSLDVTVAKSNPLAASFFVAASGTLTKLDESSCPVGCSQKNISVNPTVNVDVIFTEAEGYRFTNAVGCTVVEPKICRQIAGATVVRLNFEKMDASTRRLGVMFSVNTSKESPGIVVSDPEGITCYGQNKGTCYSDFAPDQLVTLTYVPSLRANLVRWNGCLSTSTTADGFTCTVKMTSDKVVTIEVNIESQLPSDHAVVIAKVNGPGKVKSSPFGIVCYDENSPDGKNFTCSADFRPGTSVTLTASPLEGGRFIYWDGDGTCSGSNPTCTFTAQEGLTYKATANFAADSNPSPSPTPDPSDIPTPTPTPTPSPLATSSGYYTPMPTYTVSPSASYSSSSSISPSSSYTPSATYSMPTTSISPSPTSNYWPTPTLVYIYAPTQEPMFSMPQ